MGIGHRQDAFDFRQRNHRQEANEKQGQGEEQAEVAKHLQPIDPGRIIPPPTGGKEVVMEGLHDDDEAFIPHADIDAGDHQEDKPGGLSAPADPEELRQEQIAGDHHPVSPGVISSPGPIDKGLPFVGVPRIPGDEQLHSVGVADQGAGG